MENSSDLVNHPTAKKVRRIAFGVAVVSGIMLVLEIAGIIHF